MYQSSSSEKSMRCRKIRLNPRDDGTTLVELLVGLVVASVIASAAGTVLLGHIKSSATLELAQRQRDNASRLDYLIQIEAGEAASVIENPSLEGCSGGGTGVVGFRIPRDRGQYLDANNASIVTYFNKNGDIWRCGPEVKRNGRLDHNPSLPLVSGIAVRDAALEKLICADEITDSGQFVYQLKFANGFKSDCSVARAKTILICNLGETCS